MYRNGQHAARLLRLAAHQGNAAAQYELGVMHSHGEGVNEDLEEARRLWGLAAAQGHAAAQTRMVWKLQDLNRTLLLRLLCEAVLLNVLIEYFLVDDLRASSLACFLTCHSEASACVLFCWLLNDKFCVIRAVIFVLVLFILQARGTCWDTCSTKCRRCQRARAAARLVPSDEVYFVEGSASCDGTYIMTTDVVVNGRFIWEHVTKDRAMYLANDGDWYVSDKAEARAGATSGYMALSDHGDKYSPSSLDTRQWYAEGQVWTGIRVLGKEEAEAEKAEAATELVKLEDNPELDNAKRQQRRRKKEQRRLGMQLLQRQEAVMQVEQREKKLREREVQRVQLEQLQQQQEQQQQQAAVRRQQSQEAKRRKKDAKAQEEKAIRALRTKEERSVFWAWADELGYGSAAHETGAGGGVVDSAGDSDVCVICMAEPKSVALVHLNETSHRCVCVECSDRLKAASAACPVCRLPIICHLKNQFES